MFHVLAGSATIQKAWPEEEATKILCNVKTPRCAISQVDFDKFVKANKLNTRTICKVCHQQASRR